MEKCKILLNVDVYDEYFQKMVKELAKYSKIDVAIGDNYTLTDYDIFIGKKLSKEKLEKASNLKVIFAYKTGVDDFPLDELKVRNIILVNSHIDSKIIAEYAFGLAISLVTRICEFDNDLRKGIWYHKDNEYWKSIFNMKVGLFGYGHIGKNVHQILLNNHIDTYTIDRGHSYQNINLVRNIEELIEKTDLIICSVPKLPTTDNIFNKERLEKMKGKYLVNVGRSNVINQKDLYKALVSKKIAGAAIDTWEQKPKDKDTLLLPSKESLHELNNIIISPHAAMRVEEGHRQYIEDITSKVIEYITDNHLKDVVSLEKGY